MDTFTDSFPTNKIWILKYEETTDLRSPIGDLGVRTCKDHFHPENARSNDANIGDLGVWISIETSLSS